jgi:hypothetical protein
MGATVICDTAHETPLALCAVVWSARGRYWPVTVLQCPLCRRKHFHGAGDGPDPDLGARVAHCWDRSGSYELLETPASIAARTLPQGCIGPECAVRIDHQVHRCTGCD